MSLLTRPSSPTLVERAQLAACAPDGSDQHRGVDVVGAVLVAVGASYMAVAGDHELSRQEPRVVDHRASAGLALVEQRSSRVFLAAHVLVRRVVQHLERAVRLDPLEAMRDLQFPQRGPGYLDIAAANGMLRDAAQIWIANDIELYEDESRGRPLEVLHTLRMEMGDRLGLRSTNTLAFAWVVDITVEQQPLPIATITISPMVALTWSPRI